jgi:acyl carrier protein
LRYDARSEPPIRATIREILLEKLKLGEDEFDDAAAAAGLRRRLLLGAMIVQVVQDEFDIQMPMTALIEHPSLRQLSAFIHNEFVADHRGDAGRHRYGLSSRA